MVTVRQGKANKYQVWRPTKGQWVRVCTLPTKHLSGGNGNEVILPVGVRP